MATAGDIDGAQTCLRRIDDPASRAVAAAVVAVEAARAGRTEQARKLAGEADTLGRALNSPLRSVWMWVTRAVAAASGAQRAHRFVRSIGWANWSDFGGGQMGDYMFLGSLGSDIAAGLAVAGDFAGAWRIEEPYERSRAKLRMSHVVPPDAARRLIAEVLWDRHWHGCWEALGRVDPAALMTLADDRINDVR
ncbi:hypothetical protein [Dactylosporangium sp. NPDC005555]|uniref:hypothetical protein n=1 Tax=Dactylosporangium sp. NPDC005555 TaxID=3154889 RepID=UPI0033BC845C